MAPLDAARCSHLAGQPSSSKAGRSRNARRRAQRECCGGTAVTRRDCKSRPARMDLTSPAKLPPRLESEKSMTSVANQSVATPPKTPPSTPPLDETKVVEGRRRRSVSFDLEAETQHEVIPYGEIYGIHPSEFLFERNGFVLLLADNDLYDEDGGDQDSYEDEDEDDDDDDDTEEDPVKDNWVVVHCD